ncbi:TonB-dependent receptor [Nonlabens sp. SCSIO 43208]|uniref:TonB-dependent receptor n=1 Tax=Nonlabens sp. SCSIO 43208 TaxID=2793009 RepID=UPI003D6C36E4
MKILNYLIFFISISSIAQTSITGTVVEPDGTPVLGANVYLEGTYDGTTTNIDGAFNFTTTQTGAHTLVITFIGYDEFRHNASVGQMQEIKVRLRESMNSLNTVVISAGSFSAGDNSKTNALKPLDIVTTAGALGDVIGAFQTLPGTSANPDDGRLFIRGGQADETQIFIDGSRVFQPFLPVTGNIPTRGRFSPFLFDGISFSTGGYSAEFGNALSGVLLLNSTDLPLEERTDLSVMTVGASASRTEIWDNESITVNASYFNLGPYNELIPQNNQFEDPYQSLAGEAVYRKKTNKGLFKAYGAYSYSDFSLIQEDINLPDGIFFGLNNNNLYGNLNYEVELGNEWSLESGASLSHDRTQLKISETRIRTQQNATHLKVKTNKRYSNYFNMSYGVEQLSINTNQDVALTNESFKSGITFSNTAAYAESEIFANKSLAFKIGVRADYYDHLQKVNVSPRLSAALSLTDHSQVSLAYGDFYQPQTDQALQYESRLDNQRATHFIANYLYKKNGRMLRIEAYRKNYNQLLRYDTSMPEINSSFNTTGDGYAQGLDVFWRDDKSLKNLEYWVSYSYLDTERQFRNFPEQATPNFATDHNLSIVTKYWVEDWKSQLGLTYNLASGRPYTDPNSSGFQNSKAKSFQSLDMSWAYLIDDQKILYLSVSNVLGRDNVFGYQYSNTQNSNAQFDRRTIGQAADRFIFLGFFWTIGGNDNQLDNL